MSRQHYALPAIWFLQNDQGLPKRTRFDQSISEYCPFKASCHLDAEPEPLGWINEQVVEDGHLRCQNVEGVKL